MIVRTTRNLINLSTIGLRYSFCLNKALLNPYKHTTMMHSPHNMYVDLYDFGEYPQVIAPASIPSRKYEPVVISTLVSVLNATYKTNLTQEDIVNNRQKSLKRFIVKNLHNTTESVGQVFSPVLNKLATDIIVKESRWTWIKQQRQRLKASSLFLKKAKPQTIGDFIDSYNALIQQLVLASTYGLSPHIPQAPTPLQKHYANQMRTSQNQGVDELNSLQGDKKNFINRAMAFIHKL